jgi:hypothetical protein
MILARLKISFFLDATHQCVQSKYFSIVPVATHGHLYYKKKKLVMPLFGSDILVDRDILVDISLTPHPASLRTVSR